MDENELSSSRALLYLFLEKMAKDFKITLKNIADKWEGTEKFS
jgi:hypothetical protein